MKRISIGRVSVGLLAVVAVGLSVSRPASATVCFTSGKVYVQQKVYDKAAYFLECARKAEPENIDALSLLAFARAQQRQYISAGAAFQMALDLAKKKNDTKKIQDLERNRLAVNAQLFNAGVKALSGSKGAEIPPESGSTLAAYAPPPAPQIAVTDTTVFPPFTGASRLEEAAYDFILASYVDGNSVETYQNLAYVMGGLNRTDDAIRAASRGLEVKPDDQRLLTNMRAAVMGKAVAMDNDGKYAEAIDAYREAKKKDPDPKAAPGYQVRIAAAYYKLAEKATKGSPEQTAAFDSAAVGYSAVLDEAAASDSLKQNALYNAAVIKANQGKTKEAIALLDRGNGLYPNNKDMWSLNGQLKNTAEDYKGAVAALKHAMALDPQDPADHQALFLALNKTGDREASVAEYSIYKALNGGTKKDPKVWADSADNRLGAQNQLKGILKAEGYPEEVYTYSEENKTFETWFFWSKGKSFTFMEGQIFSKGAFPPKKSS
jgi:tetratricopeptide (TPR) repeat protein